MPNSYENTDSYRVLGGAEGESPRKLETPEITTLPVGVIPSGAQVAQKSQNPSPGQPPFAEPFRGFSAVRDVAVVHDVWTGSNRLWDVPSGHERLETNGRRWWVGFLGNFSEEVADGFEHGLHRAEHPDAVESLLQTSPMGLDARAYVGGLLFGRFWRIFGPGGSLSRTVARTVPVGIEVATPCIYCGEPQYEGDDICDDEPACDARVRELARGGAA